MKRPNYSVKTAPDPAKPNTSIWRYMSLHSFLTLLIKRRLFFRQFRELQRLDQREGMVTPGFWESVVKFYRQQTPNTDTEELRRRAEATLDKLRYFGYASCWTMGKAENALMWKAYAPQGIAIKTTVRKLKNAPQNTDHERLTIRSQIIAYADHWTELERRGYQHTGIPLNKLFLHTKRKAFRGEKEIRFSIQPSFPFKQSRTGQWTPPDPLNCPLWFPVEFEDLKWIEDAVAESSIPESQVATIKQLAGDRHVRFHQSGL